MAIPDVLGGTTGRLWFGEIGWGIGSLMGLLSGIQFWKIKGTGCRRVI